MWLAGTQTVLSCVTVGLILNARFPDFGMPACLLVGAIASAVDRPALREAFARRQGILLEQLSAAVPGRSRGLGEDTRTRMATMISSAPEGAVQQLKDLDATIFGESVLSAVYPSHWS